MDQIADRNAAMLRAADPLLVMRRVVDESLALIPAAQGAVVELAAGGVLTYVCAGGNLHGSVGLRLPAAGSLSGLATSLGQVLVCADAETDDRVDRAACRRVGVTSMICVPLVRGGDGVGVLKVSSRQRDAFDTEAVELLGRLGAFISDAIAGWTDLARSAAAALSHDTPVTASIADPDGHHGTPIGAMSGGKSGEVEAAAMQEERISRFVANVMQPGSGDAHDARERVQKVLDGAGPVMHFQPIVDLKTGRLAGCEALARFPSGSRSPESWFQDAARVGLSAELQLAAISAALEQLPQLPARTYLAVNVGHDLAACPKLYQLIETVDAARVVIELTEHEQVLDYPSLISAIDRLRATGARLAIDDTGAGFAGFSHILKLAPDLIKLDRILTNGIDTDPARQALAGALVNFACATGAQVIAEGIETPAELTVVHQLGIGYGQGYHLGRPGPLAHLLDHDAHPVPIGQGRRHDLPRTASQRRA